MKFIAKYLSYKSLTVLFLISSLIGSVYLVKLEQDNRGKAVGPGECACKNASTGATTSGTCKPDGGCICPAGTNPGTNKCAVGGGGGGQTQCTDQQVKDAGLGGSLPARCSSLGAKACQKDSSNKNTGYQCECIDLSPGACSFYANSCTKLNLEACPQSSGGATSGNYENSNIISCGGVSCRADECHCQGGESCVTQVCEPAIRASCLNQNRAWCKQGAGTTCCVEGYKCGSNNTGCVLVDLITATPTKKPPTSTPTIPKSTITPTQTPTGTLVPTNTPTITITPTQTPTGTLVPTNTPTITLTPTQTPTGTLVPTNTPTPTTVVLGCGYTPCDDNDRPCSSGLTCISADNGNRYCSQPSYVDACKINPGYTSCCTAPQGPSPTRIILPNAGFEFPAQALTVVGVIVTLFGFLILL